MFEVLSIKMSVMVTVLCESRLNFDLKKRWTEQSVSREYKVFRKKKNNDLTQRLSIISLLNGGCWPQYTKKSKSKFNKNALPEACRNKYGTVLLGERMRNQKSKLFKTLKIVSDNSTMHGGWENIGTLVP